MSQPDVSSRADALDAPGDAEFDATPQPPACMDGWRQIHVARSGATTQQLAAPRVRQLPLVDQAPPFLLLSDGVRRAVGSEVAHAADVSDEGISFSGWTGAGVRVVVVDGGVDPDHPDFQRLDGSGSRVRGDPPGPGLDPSHGTRVAGVIAGNGRASDGADVGGRVRGPFELRGHAPGVDEIISVRPDGGDLHPFARQFAHVFNHSHAFSNNVYDARVAQYDDIIHRGYLQPPRVVIVAAGNNGTGGEPPFYNSRGYYSILNPMKNTICVGSVNENDFIYSPRASMGPTADGRIKPDLVVPGHRDYRPPAGLDFAVDEMRLVSADGQSDRVWSTTGDDGWVPAGEYAGLAAMEERTVAGGMDDYFEMAPPEGIDAAGYTGISFRARLDLDPSDPAHAHPPWFVVTFDLDADGTFESGFYPAYGEDARTNGTHETRVDFAALSVWRGTIGGIRVIPVVYDDGIYVPAPGGGYEEVDGTSYAAPVVSGGAALLLEQFATLHGYDIEERPPLPSTVKAILIHTARDLVHETPSFRDPPNPDTGMAVTYFQGPDFATGHGLVDLEAATKLVANHSAVSPRFVEDALADGETHVYRVFLSSDAPVEVTLVWDDAPGDPSLELGAPQLVNDLDVVAVSPSGRAHGPWVLEPPPYDASTWGDGLEIINESPRARRCVSDAPFADPECVDRRNNVEKIVVDVPDDGQWDVVVRASVPGDEPQRYSLVVTQRCTGS